MLLNEWITLKLYRCYCYSITQHILKNIYSTCVMAKEKENNKSHNRKLISFIMCFSLSPRFLWAFHFIVKWCESLFNWIHRFYCYIVCGVLKINTPRKSFKWDSSLIFVFSSFYVTFYGLWVLVVDALFNIRLFFLL